MPHSDVNPVIPRFMTPDDVAETLAVSRLQVLALLRHGEIRGVKIGGRGTWRIELGEFERYINRAYANAGSQVHHRGVEAARADGHDTDDVNDAAPDPAREPAHEAGAGAASSRRG